MRRLVAVCKGGPLDGQLFSVAAEEGPPEPMYGRVAVAGVLYVPGAAVELAPEYAALFPYEHDGAIVFEPATGAEEAALMSAYWDRFDDLDENGVPLPTEEPQPPTVN